MLTDLSKEMQAYLIYAVANKKSILIGGLTGTGKSTLLKELMAHIPKEERILLLEVIDTTVKERMTTSELIDVIEQKPERLVIDEIRSHLALDVYQALLARYPMLATIHSSDADHTVERFVNIAIHTLEERGVPYHTAGIQARFNENIDMVIQVARVDDNEKTAFVIDSIVAIDPDGQDTIYQR